MLWTTDTPTKSGWYWFQVRMMKPRIIEVIVEHEPERLLISESATPVDALQGAIYRWAGPLDLPQEP
jgi:hypothetical protein